MSKPYALIVDDNRNNLSVLAELLRLEGIEHTAVQNPNRLNDVLAGLKQLDVVFLDLEMPGLDGFAVLKMIKAIPRFSQIPVVAYTVHVSEASVARDAGFHSFLAKPIDADRFPGQLERILHNEPVWAVS